MKQRGTRSAASLVVPKQVLVELRLPAPVTLSDAERSVWLDLVNDQPAGVFTPTHIPLMEQYCRHVVQCRVLADEVQNFDRAWLADDDGLKRYDRLLGMSEREGRAASSLATRLRITRQAVDHPTTAAAKLQSRAKSRKPWEMPAEIEQP